MASEKKTSQKTIRKRSYLVFGASIIILAVSFLVHVVNNYPLQEKTIYASVNITGRLGFDVNGSSLTFGEIAIYGTSSRNVLFSNDYDFPVIVKMNASGSIAPLLEFEKSVEIEPREQKRISFSVVAGNYSNGYYDGNVKFRVFPA